MTKINELIDAYELLIQKILETRFDEENQFSMITDKVILGLFKSVLDKAKSLNYLIENKMYSGTDTLLRSVFESATHLEFILKEDMEIRAEAYYLSDKIKTLKIHEQSMADDKKGRSIRSLLGQSKEHLEDVYNLVSEKNRISERYREIVGHSKADKWYKVNGEINSFQQVCENLGEDKLAIYEIAYRILSQETHGKEAGEYFRFVEGELILAPIGLNPVMITLLRTLINNSAKIVAEKYDCLDLYRHYYIHSMQSIIAELRNF